jgi:high-affinity Fe2+/Pb2+ permease
VADAPAGPGAARELRGHLLRLALGVVAVHAVAIALYYALDVASRSVDFQRGFTVAWTVATLPVVLVGLSRVRAARLRARHARRQQQGR